MKICGRKFISIVLSVASVCIFTEMTLLAYANNISDSFEDGGQNFQNAGGYFSYFNIHSDDIRPTAPIDISVFDYSDGTPDLKTVDGVESIVFDAEHQWTEWMINVESPGCYSFYMTYRPMEGTGKDILLSVGLDGEIPFDEASNLSLPRLWKDKTYENGTTIVRDAQGNDLRPEQVEAPRFITAGLKDTIGLYEQPYLFFLSEGTHTLRLTVQREAFALSGIAFRNESEPISYSDYFSGFDETNYVTDTEPVRLEAELTSEKNNSILSPGYDMTSAATVPSDPSKIRINTIGGSNWNVLGSSASWRVEVPHDGLYRLSFRCRQNFSEGMSVYRRLYINGEVPFKEAENILFPYKQGWYIKTLGDDKPLYVFLKSGDILTLQCVSGNLSMPMREIQQSVLKLNDIYRSIIMVTGTSPDIYQEFNLEEQIPDLVQSMRAVSGRLESVSKVLSDALGKSSSGSLTVNKSINIISSLADDTYYIPERLHILKDAIESLSSLLLVLGGQPLELDSLFFIPRDADIPKAGAGFFSDTEFAFKRFLSSFFNDYSSIGDTSSSEKEAVTVWAGMGRDQIRVLNRLAVEQFTRNTKIPVKMNIVSGEQVLIKSALAGKGPDIALGVGQVSPVNLAARGSITDLSQFDLSQLRSEIHDSAWESFKYEGGVYAIPESQGFDVMFYRTDIFKALEIEPPDTWDDFYKVLKVLQSNKLQVCMNEVDAGNQGSSLAISAFDRFLLQNGGAYYNENLSKTMFNTEVAYQAFEQTVDLYRTYGISRDISFFNRFRSGETPLGIAGYATYMQIWMSAPELRGLWSFTMIPGTIQADGQINRAESSGVAGCVMMSSAEKRGAAENSFEFMKWWCGSDTQIRYGNEIEAVNGIAFRTMPANHVALNRLGWTEAEIEVINGQEKWIKNPPQVLGGYTLSRALTSAIRGAINDENTPRRSLAVYDKDINDEIARKRKEFKLD